MHACPRCLDGSLRASPGAAADEVDLANADALACSECGGAWLTAAAAQRVLPPRFGPLSELPAVATGFGALRCPECHAELARRRVGDVDIDVCTQHGAWFDHREVERIRDAAHHPRVVDAAMIGGGLLVVDAGFRQSAAPPAMNASASDVGTAIDAVVIVADVGITSAEVAAAVVEVGVLDVVEVGAAADAAGVLDVLAGIFDGLFSL